MNTAAAAISLPLVRRTVRERTTRRLSPRGGEITVRTATSAEAGAIHRLISQHLAEGHLLPRDESEIAVHAHRFVVALDGRRVIA